MNTADKILDLLKEGLSAWKTFISTREAAYNRKRDKEQVAAIEAAEKYIFTNEALKAATEDKEIRKIQQRLSYWKIRFFKFH